MDVAARVGSLIADAEERMIVIFCDAHRIPLSDGPQRVGLAKVNIPRQEGVLYESWCILLDGAGDRTMPFVQVTTDGLRVAVNLVRA